MTVSNIGSYHLIERLFHSLKRYVTLLTRWTFIVALICEIGIGSEIDLVQQEEIPANWLTHLQLTSISISGIVPVLVPFQFPLPWWRWGPGQRTPSTWCWGWEFPWWGLWCVVVLFHCSCFLSLWTMRGASASLCEPTWWVFVEGRGLRNLRDTVDEICNAQTHNAATKPISWRGTQWTSCKVGKEMKAHRYRTVSKWSARNVTYFYRPPTKL